jgi:hypothetical protein
MLFFDQTCAKRQLQYRQAYAKALFELIDMEPKLSSTENSHYRSMTDTTCR